MHDDVQFTCSYNIKSIISNIIVRNAFVIYLKQLILSRYFYVGFMNILCLSLFTYNYSIVITTTIISVIITPENINKDLTQIPSSIKLLFFLFTWICLMEHDLQGNENKIIFFRLNLQAVFYLNI